MARSKFKGPVIHPLIQVTHKEQIKIFYKNSIILPEYMDFRFRIYNGRKFILLSITEPMIGHKFGEFIYTRATYKFKKKNK